MESVTCVRYLTSLVFDQSGHIVGWDYIVGWDAHNKTTCAIEWGSERVVCPSLRRASPPRPFHHHGSESGLCLLSVSGIFRSNNLRDSPRCNFFLYYRSGSARPSNLGVHLRGGVVLGGRFWVLRGRLGRLYSVSGLSGLGAGFPRFSICRVGNIF